MQIDTPLGPFHIATRNGVLVVGQFDTPVDGPADARIATRIRAYFDGDIEALEKLPAEPEGTPFQKRVWKALREIPVGRTWSYRQLAERVGSHPRAVGSANGANPVALIVPCHRVIAADGSLCGYGAGLGRKRWLIAHERGQVQARLPAAEYRAP
ncbi:MAG TPA: methylated-DNA--[protein]-cysteine S-methyltransferase [Myxococcales bacterium]|nr:methylated-DNA--[protein]-cysteine S-methyltransferase [Myxococcales bacterium]